MRRQNMSRQHGRHVLRCCNRRSGRNKNDRGKLAGIHTVAGAITAAAAARQRGFLRLRTIGVLRMVLRMRILLDRAHGFGRLGFGSMAARTARNAGECLERERPDNDQRDRET